MSDYGIVYKLTNLINGKSYVGITRRTLEERFEEHKKSKYPIGKAIRKYGESAFIKTILDYADNKEELCYLEKENIEKYQTFKNGYNLTLGGDGVITVPKLKIPYSKLHFDFYDFVDRENKKNIDVFNDKEMIKNMVINTVRLYLISENATDKIKSAKLIMRLRKEILIQILNSKLVTLEELLHYSCQKLSNFKEFSYG